MSGILMSALGNWKVAAAAASAALIFDLDAANFASVPVPSSAQFSGSNWLSFSPGVTVGAGAYTVEGWAYFSTASLPGVMLSTLTPGNNGFSLVIFSATQIRIDRNGFAADTYNIPAMASNTWHHIAATRDSSGNQTIFVDGVRSTTGTITNNSNFSGVSAGIGKFNEGGQWWYTGYFSNIRAVVGSNVYDPTQATITVPTGPLPVVTNTTILLQGRADASGTQTITNNGAVALNALYPFAAPTDATGTYTLSITNAGSITYSSANGGSWLKSNNVGTDFIYGGPNYVTAQSYTVFMAYKLSATASGRLLNTQSEASKDWLMGGYNGNPKTFYPNFSVNLPGSGADTVWHLDWATWNTTTGVGNLYAATNTAPSGVSFTGTNAGGGGFNQLRLFSRSGGAEVQSGNIAVIKVYNGVLDLATIQAQYATYAARFGY
jgi:hypothetical protein